MNEQVPGLAGDGVETVAGATVVADLATRAHSQGRNTHPGTQDRTSAQRSYQTRLQGVVTCRKHQRGPNASEWLAQSFEPFTPAVPLLTGHRQLGAADSATARLRGKTPSRH